MSDSKNKNKKSQSNIAGNVTQAFKKIISAGSAAEISKEFISTAIGQAGKAKDDITEKVTGEVMSWIKKIDFGKELSKFAEDHTFKVSAEIDISKKKKSLKD